MNGWLTAFQRETIGTVVLDSSSIFSTLFVSTAEGSNRAPHDDILMTLFGSRLLVGESWRCESMAGKGDAAASPECNVPVRTAKLGGERREPAPAGSLARGPPVPALPVCVSDQTGSYREYQRYLCKDCDHIFNDKTARFSRTRRSASTSCGSRATRSSDSTLVSAS